MLTSWFKKKKAEPSQTQDAAPEKKAPADLDSGLKKTKGQWARGAEALASVFLGKKALDQEVFDALETQLLTADVGLDVCDAVIADLTAEASRSTLKEAEAVHSLLRQSFLSMLQQVQPVASNAAQAKPKVILMIGVNGVGKTTSMAKLAHRYGQQGQSVVMAAGDTFRAAAIEQLQTWGERLDVPVIAQQPGADSAAVIFDAYEAAKARGTDVLIADTAGRLHNQDHLMKELEKIVRILKRSDERAPHEVLLVLDASTGQNGIAQVQGFSKHFPVDGVVLTKLDGTAKGGVVFAIAKQLGLPVKYIGLGEGMEDLQPFDSEAFVEALFS